MEKIMELYSKYRDYILFSIVFIVFSILCGFIFWYFSNDLSEIKKELKKSSEVSSVSMEEVKTKFIVDIKGEVKTPGVYILDEGKRVMDVVKKAGGFTRNADTSANNLSMKIADEMVIVIYSKEEIKDYLKTKEEESLVLEKCKNDVIVNNSCVGSDDSLGKGTSDNSDNNKVVSSDSSKDESSLEGENKLVSINTASIDELMTLSGIGQSKAEAIIEYRESKKFETIEEIKEVPGIGDALFEKIKDYITT